MGSDGSTYLCDSCGHHVCRACVPPEECSACGLKELCASCREDDHDVRFPPPCIESDDVVYVTGGMPGTVYEDGGAR